MSQTAPIAAPSRRAAKVAASSAHYMPSAAEIDALVVANPGLKRPAARMRLIRANAAPASAPAAAKVAAPAPVEAAPKASRARKTPPAPPVAVSATATATRAPRAAKVSAAGAVESSYIVTVVDATTLKSKTIRTSGADISSAVASLI